MTYEKSFFRLPWTQALNAVDEAIALVQQNDERYYLAELYRLRGELSEVEHAEASLKQSIEITASQKALSWRLRSAMSLGRLYLRAGKISEARRLRSDVYCNFTEGFNTQDLVDAQQLLEQ
jgi:predicted ATPase